MANSPLARTNPALIRYPRFNQLHQDIQMCQELSSLAGEPQCMALEGRPGAGKSTLVTTFATAFPRYDTPEGTKIPVFYLETPSPVTVKGMAARMLEVLGDPAAHKGPLWAMNSRLIHYLKEACEVQLVILDDFHHLIDQQTNRILETVSDWLKVLIKETQLPFLVVGTIGKVEQILTANDQLSRLFAVREKLHPFQWADHDDELIQEFAAFITYVEQAVGLPLSNELERRHWLHRLHLATDGVVGQVMNLIRLAAFIARCQGASTLTLALLAQAFAKRHNELVATTANPFTTVTLPTARASQLLLPNDPPGSVNRRAKRRKQPQPTAAEVLKTT